MNLELSDSIVEESISESEKESLSNSFIYIYYLVDWLHV